MLCALRFLVFDEFTRCCETGEKASDNEGGIGT
jgi:hypothetical protein